VSDVTQVLVRVQQADARAAEDLLALRYEEPRNFAPQRMAAESPGQTEEFREKQ